MIKILNECRLVIPSVEFLQHEHAKQRVHLVACRTRVVVVYLESEVGKRKGTNEPLDQVMGVVAEPRFRDSENI